MGRIKIGRTYFYIFFGLASIATIVGFIFLIKNYEYFNNLQPHSYIGLVAISFLAAAPIPVFIPNSIIVFMLGSVLNPLLIGLASGLGSTIGNTATYYTGRAGKHVFSSLYSGDSVPLPGKLSNLLLRLEQSRLYHNRLLTLFIVAYLPTPLLTPLVLSLGAARTPAWKVIGVTFLGQTLQFIMFAILGHFGLRAILDLFGVFGGS